MDPVSYPIGYQITLRFMPDKGFREAWKQKMPVI